MRPATLLWGIANGVDKYWVRPPQALLTIDSVADAVMGEGNTWWFKTVTLRCKSKAQEGRRIQLLDVHLPLVAGGSVRGHKPRRSLFMVAPKVASMGTSGTTTGWPPGGYMAAGGGLGWRRQCIPRGCTLHGPGGCPVRWRDSCLTPTTPRHPNHVNPPPAPTHPVKAVPPPPPYPKSPQLEVVQEVDHKG